MVTSWRSCHDRSQYFPFLPGKWDRGRVGQGQGGEQEEEEECSPQFSEEVDSDSRGHSKGRVSSCALGEPAQPAAGAAPRTSSPLFPAPPLVAWGNFFHSLGFLPKLLK